MVLRNEAAYLRVAQSCGLRVHGGFFTRADRLFVQRFDRVVDHDGVHRLHQESLASLAGLAGFAVPTSLNALTAALRQYASDPTLETIEFIKRDMLNRALRNTDNHARNSAVQVLQNGNVQLTPLYDFAPMFKDPEVIARSVHWRDANGRITTDIRAALHAMSEECGMDDQEQARIMDALAAWAPEVEHLASTAIDNGVDKEIVDACMGTIESVCHDLNRLGRTKEQATPPDIQPDIDPPRS
jgi:serine/threonine-protein kinase HipA